MKLTVSVREPSLRPLRPDPGASLGVARPLVLVALEDARGLVGYGEAAPLPDYDGVSIEQVVAALAQYARVLAERDEAPHAEILAACAALDPLPQALAAVDLALWDLAGHRAGQPVWALLGVSDAGPIAVNATIGSVAPRDAAEEASAAAAAGFGCVKVKVGTPDDRQRLAAIRQALGPETLIRVDANGAWTQLDAPERIRALERFEIELFEEPVHGIRAVQALARAVPDASLALDESAPLALAARAGDAIGADAPPRVCDSLCLKIAASGGITGLLRDAVAARAIGYEVYLASTLDGPLGIAAALHAAAAVRPDRHCGLATLDRFDRKPLRAMIAVDGRMGLPAGPGLGLGDELLAWYEA